MTNKDIAKAFQLLGDIMELHEENPFKIRSYHNAYITLRKWETPFSEMNDADIEQIKGVGKAIAGKIRELLDTGRMATLEKYLAMTPEGVQEMLQIKGFGPKKIRTIWKELGAETIGELLYAVNENRLIELKGFGLKTQEELRKQLEYYQRSKGLFHYAALEQEAFQLLDALRAHFPGAKAEWTGALRRRAIVLDGIDLLLAQAILSASDLEGIIQEPVQVNIHLWHGTTPSGVPVRLHICPSEAFGSKQFRFTATEPFLKAFIARNPGQDFQNIDEEAEVFRRAGLPFIAPELREEARLLETAAQGALPVLIEENDIRGVVHSHSTYSDGLHSLRDMALETRRLGYEYLVISDHSRSAFYANGLSVERVLEQMAEIDALNRELAPFRIFKSIESDILSDGSLDYPDELLSRFDCVIASVHSNLKMDMDKATARLLRAIEHPATRILGHPTGRLLLSRPGYPIDHQKIIDACAANGVALELNANPYRLDIDWTWIPYAREKGVLISINPDAHSKEGIRDIHFGVLAARKGGLSAAECLNAMGLEAFQEWLRAPL